MGFLANEADPSMGFCARHGGWVKLELLAVDRTRPNGRKPICKRCDSERALARYYAKRGPQPVRHCSECGSELEGRRRVVCSERCREGRFKRLHPEAYAAREARKVERRRERRREASAGDAPADDWSKRVEAWVERSCAEQGVPVKITDPLVLAEIAEILRLGREKRDFEG